MKTASSKLTLVAGLVAAAFASAVDSAPEADAAALAHLEDATPEQRALAEADLDEQRKLSNCWTDNLPAAAWHPVYSAGWTNGFCRYTIDCNSPSYTSQLACCKGAYGGQVSGRCLAGLPNPPTTSPTSVGGLDVYYPDYATSWSDAYCINDGPLPSGRPTYSTLLACCKGAYAGQMSGKCLSMLPSPPTTSPTSEGGLDVYYPDYSLAWSDAYCINTGPLPSGRPTYSTLLACCKGAYAGQMSGKCLSMLPSPPTTSPTSEGGFDFYYPDYDTDWSTATCKNSRPLPFGPGGRPTYSTMLACCKGAYAGQTTGACLAGLPSPPTSSPTTAGGLDIWYPNYVTWSQGKCINERPLPSGRPSYSSQVSCCNGAYGGQTSSACICDALPVAQATCVCACGYNKTDRDSAGCGNLWCTGDPTVP